jgi:nucleotide-binding universal stress UspA family protein
VHLLVVGASGHSPVAGLLMGSVSQYVSQRADSPVVVVREQAHPTACRIVVGLDGSPASDKAVAFAFEVAAQAGGLPPACCSAPSSIPLPEREMVTYGNAQC